jgi:hypothetical protein
MAAPPPPQAARDGSTWTIRFASKVKRSGASITYTIHDRRNNSASNPAGFRIRSTSLMIC